MLTCTTKYPSRHGCLHSQEGLGALASAQPQGPPGRGSPLGFRNIPSQGNTNVDPDWPFHCSDLSIHDLSSCAQSRRPQDPLLSVREHPLQTPAFGHPLCVSPESLFLRVFNPIKPVLLDPTLAPALGGNLTGDEANTSTDVSREGVRGPRGSPGDGGLRGVSE